MKSLSRINVLLALLLVAALTFGITGKAEAAIIDHGGTISKNEVIDDDLVIMADSVSMQGTVNGLLIAMGDDVTISGNVNGDVVAMGRVVTIESSAEITGNLFAAAQVLSINGEIKGTIISGSYIQTIGSSAEISRNVFSAGFALENMTKSSVGRDMYAAAYQVVLSGEVKENAVVYASAIELDGTVDGNAKFVLDNSADNYSYSYYSSIFSTQGLVVKTIRPGLHFGSKASIGGELAYTAENEESIPSAVTGQVIYSTPVPDVKTEYNRAYRVYSTTDWAFDLLRSLATLFIIGALALWLIPALVRKPAEEITARPWASLGWGFAVAVGAAVIFILAGIVIFLLFLLFSLLTLGDLAGYLLGIGIFGVTLAVILFTMYGLLIAKVIVAFLVGNWLVSKIAPASAGNKWLALLAGVPVVALLCALPYVGVVFTLAIAFTGFGAAFNLNRARRTPAAPAAPYMPPAPYPTEPLPPSDFPPQA